MDETRALLDALMGPNRNSKEVVETGRPDFANDSVCKNALVGFCPHDWFSMPKRALKPCHKIHSEVMREKFLAHPETEKYRAEYEEEFLKYLERVAQDCDAFIAREKPKCRPRGAGGKALRMPPEVKDRVEELEKRYAELVKSSEELADESLSRSQEQMRQALVIKEEVDGTKHRYTSEFHGEDICEVCGVKYPLGGGSIEWHDKESHKRGKTHQGFAQIRDKINELRGKRREWEKWREHRNNDEEERDKLKDREKDKDRHRERDKDREKVKEKDRDRERDRERARNKDRDRDKDRSRERDREKERGKDRVRDKDKGREAPSRSRSVDSFGRSKKDKFRHAGREDNEPAKQDDGDRSRSKGRSGNHIEERSRSRQWQRDQRSTSSSAPPVPPPPSSAPPPPPPPPEEEEEEEDDEEEEDIPSVWRRIQTVDPSARQRYIKGLSAATQDRLEAWLLARMSRRKAA